MNVAAITVVVYGVIVAIGGLIGFLTAGSMPSLIMGSIFGALLIIAGIAMIKKTIWGFPLAFILLFCLSVFFIYRFVLTMNPMPAGIMVAITLIVLSIVMRTVTFERK